MKFSRIELNYGKSMLEKLSNSTIVVIGIGGVGGFCVEALARSSVGRLIIIDKDDVDITNINRQIIALDNTIGKSKVEVMKDRIKLINDKCEVIAIKDFYSSLMDNKILEFKPDFVVDACDTISSKFDIIKFCLTHKIKFVCAMGAANKVRPEKFVISKLEKTNYDPIARILRKKVKDERVKGIIPVVYSEEIPQKSKLINEQGKTRKEKYPPASNAFTPSVSGLLCASFVINSIVEDKYSF